MGKDLLACVTVILCLSSIVLTLKSIIRIKRAKAETIDLNFNVTRNNNAVGFDAKKHYEKVIKLRNAGRSFDLIVSTLKMQNYCVEFVLE